MDLSCVYKRKPSGREEGSGSLSGTQTTITAKCYRGSPQRGWEKKYQVPFSSLVPNVGWLDCMAVTVSCRTARRRNSPWKLSLRTTRSSPAANEGSNELETGRRQNDATLKIPRVVLSLCGKVPSLSIYLTDSLSLSLSSSSSSSSLLWMLRCRPAFRLLLFKRERIYYSPQFYVPIALNIPIATAF